MEINPSLRDLMLKQHWKLKVIKICKISDKIIYTCSRAKKFYLILKIIKDHWEVINHTIEVDLCLEILLSKEASVTLWGPQKYILLKRGYRLHYKIRIKIRLLLLLLTWLRHPLHRQFLKKNELTKIKSWKNRKQ